MNSIVKLMELKDLETIRRLSNELGYPALEAEFLERFREISALKSHRLLTVSDGEIRGWMHLEVVHDLIEPKKVEIKALVVEQAFRGKGLGTSLIISARSWAQELGLHTIYLSCNIVRDKAHQFYLKQGFKKHKTSYFFELTV